MKKLLVAVLACAMVAPAFAAFDNVKVTGDIQTISLAMEGNGSQAFLGDNQVRRGTSNRVMLGVAADLVEDVTAKITLEHHWISGITGTVGNDLTGGGILDRTQVAEAFVVISNVFNALEVKVGRQFYGDEKSPVMYFGPNNGYALFNTYFSVEGATLRYNDDKFSITGAYFTLDYAGWDADDLNIAGLDGILKVNDNLSVQAYIYDIQQRGVPVTTNSFWGVKPTLETDVLKAGVEFARNYGAVEKGYLLKADVALPIDLDKATLTPRATYIQLGNNFRDSYGNYRAGIIFGNEGDLVTDVDGGGAERLEVINIGICMKFASAERWGFALDFYKANVHNINNIVGNRDFQANSWEAKVMYNHNEYVAFQLAGAILTGVGQKLTESPNALQISMNIKF